ncbi:MAG TPA: AI-2E family transporter [Actinomycetota bacterium]|nr:AI-2E family transporter [Actinomycetota bacterium]
MQDEPNRVLATPLVIRAARWGVVAWAAIGVSALTIAFFAFVVYPIRIIFPPLVVALIAVFLLNPIVSRLEARGMPRLLGALLTYSIFVAIVALGLRFLIPIVVAQAQEFGETVPALVDRLQRWTQGVAGGLGFDVAGETGGRQVLDFLGGLLSFTRGLFHVALVLVLGPILAFYLLVDLPKIRRGIEALIPERRRDEVHTVARELSHALGGFFRGQLLVAASVGIGSAIALFIVGLPYWAVVGLVAGLFNLIPLIGPFIGGLVAIAIAFTTDQSGGLLSLAPGVPLAVGSAIALTIVQQLDNHILSPNIVARTVKLHPVTVMLALLAGGTLLGLWGMLLAVPVVASVKVLALHAWDTRMTWPPPPPDAQTEPPSAAVAGPPEDPPPPSPAAPPPRSPRPRRWWPWPERSGSAGEGRRRT